MGAVEEMMRVTKGHSVYELASTLWMYDLRKGDVFVLMWARVRRLMRGCIFSELLQCGVISSCG